MPRKSDATVRADTDADTSSVLPNPHTSPSDKRDKEARESISIEVSRPPPIPRESEIEVYVRSMELIKTFTPLPRS